jgi:hypothetical protein
MTKAADYRAKLRTLDDWEPYLLQESGLPGPRGNLELAQAVADEGHRELFLRLASYSAAQAPANSPAEFLAFCGVLGLGRLLAEGDMTLFEALRRHASDPRWRTREAVAMALQRLGDADMERLLGALGEWSTGAPLEQRAAAAALCEPRLLRQPEHARATLTILDRITASVANTAERRSPDFQALRKALGYCWSVAVVALPTAGKAAMEKWLPSLDPDIRWIMRENLKKARLARMDADWVRTASARLYGA